MNQNENQQIIDELKEIKKHLQNFEERQIRYEVDYKKSKKPQFITLFIVTMFLLMTVYNLYTGFFSKPSENQNSSSYEDTADTKTYSLYTVATLIEEQQFDSALIVANILYKKNPYNSQAASYIGDIFFYKKQYDSCLLYYGNALSIMPSESDLFKVKYIQENLIRLK